MEVIDEIDAAAIESAEIEGGKRLTKLFFISFCARSNSVEQFLLHSRLGYGRACCIYALRSTTVQKKHMFFCDEFLMSSR